MNIASLSGSPSLNSRSAGLLQLARERIGGRARHSPTIVLRDLPPLALLTGDASAEPIRQAVARIAEADVLIVATPIYKAAYSGLLKIFLDLLPPEALRGKTVLPLATGGSVAHMLALDYALKPVLAALGARDILDGVFATDVQLIPQAGGGWLSEPVLLERLDRALAPLGGLQRHDREPAELALPGLAAAA